MDEMKDTEQMSCTAACMSGMTLIYCCLSMLIFMLSVMPVNERGVNVTLKGFPVLLLPGLFYLLNVFLMERQIHLNLLLVSDTLFSAAAAWLFSRSLVIEPAMPAARILFTVFFVLILAAALYVAWQPIRSQTVIGCFDWMVVLLIIYLALQKLDLTLLPFQMPVLCAFSMGVSFLTMIRIRIDRAGDAGASVGSKAAGRMMMAVLIVLIAGMALLIGAAAAGALHGFSEVLWGLIRAVSAALLWLAGCLYRVLELFARWLSQFFMPEEYEAVESQEVSSAVSGQEAVISASQVPAWFYVLLLAAAAAGAAVFLYRIRRVRLSRTSFSRPAEENMRRRSGLKEALFAFISSVSARVHLFRLYRKKRKTPAGMLIWCRRHFRRSTPQLSGESGAAYLRRLADAPEAADITKELRRLADLIEQAFYAPKTEQALSPEPDLYRKLHQAGRAKR